MVPNPLKYQRQWPLATYIGGGLMIPILLSGCITQFAGSAILPVAQPVNRKANSVENVRNTLGRPVALLATDGRIIHHAKAVNVHFCELADQEHAANLDNVHARVRNNSTDEVVRIDKVSREKIKIINNGALTEYYIYDIFSHPSLDGEKKGDLLPIGTFYIELVLRTPTSSLIVAKSNPVQIVSSIKLH